MQDLSNCIKFQWYSNDLLSFRSGAQIRFQEMAEIFVLKCVYFINFPILYKSKLHDEKNFLIFLRVQLSI